MDKDNNYDGDTEQPNISAVFDLKDLVAFVSDNVIASILHTITKLDQNLLAIITIS